ncbi:hypothetical protein BAY61_05150 [Prauserella marina]|uniref:Uncharacterized protein n=1 Tax=Prauserella marina TaxID=530584 RepID=A0A222VKR0_9PSEU|nr:hypothetical protein [Prauserella marina]ASR34477.1 hypothetical protein BAY61_05150 [Prauserella marina]PWV85928.1 hypothetical protein DES30_1011958 [Prauserella marina]SDC42114.1 hypothetical protein SAMN05421630_10234 [Prauserella marina]
MKGLLDLALRLAAERAGQPGGVRFTERQLYYELCRVPRPAQHIPRRFPFTVAPSVRYPRFREALLEAGPLPGLLPEPRPVRRGAGRHTPEPDLFDYGLPRVLVCESDAIANMLRANGIPMESACPVFGAAELPLAEGVLRMLRTAERATVYVLHDAGAVGLAFPGLVRRLTPDGVRVTGVGLRPHHARALHLAHGREHPSGPRGTMTEREEQWCALGRFAEVAAVRPASLLRTVHRLVREVRPVRTRQPSPRKARESGFLSWPSA